MLKPEQRHVQLRTGCDLCVAVVFATAPRPMDSVAAARTGVCKLAVVGPRLRAGGKGGAPGQVA